MKSYSPREVIKILKNNGWILRRIQGDHYIFKKEGIPYLISIPISKNAVSIGILKNIQRQTGIKFK